MRYNFANKIMIFTISIEYFLFAFVENGCFLKDFTCFFMLFFELSKWEELPVLLHFLRNYYEVKMSGGLQLIFNQSKLSPLMSRILVDMTVKIKEKRWKTFREKEQVFIN